MNTTCSNRVIKHIMFGFNFIFVITGIIILGVGASVKAHYYPYDTFLDDKYFSLPNMLIATGSLIFFISFLGCYGAMRENWVMLMAFSVLLTIIFIFELSVGIAGYVLRDKTSVYVENKLYETLPKYETSPAISGMWDIIQEEFQCCGVVNYTDWERAFNNELSLPVSCCPLPSGIVGVFYCNAYSTTTVTTETTTPTAETKSTESTTPEPTTTTITETTTVTTESTTSVTTESTIPPEAPTQPNVQLNDATTYPPSSTQPYTTGCSSAFGNFVKQHAVDIGGVGIALAVIQLAGIVLSFHLARQLKNGYYST